MILQKTLRKSLNQDHKFTIGDIINFGTNDCQKYGGMSSSMVVLVSTPISAAIGFSCLYQLLGVSIVPSMSIFFLLMLISFMVVRKNVVYQKEYMKLSGTLLQMTNELFSCIRFIKANGMESFFTARMCKTREKELTWLRYICYTMMYRIANSWLSSSILYVLPFLFYVFMGNVLTVAKIFTVLAVLRTFQDSLAYLPIVFASFLDVIVSSERLKNYLISEEKNHILNSYDPNGEFDLRISNASFYWRSLKLTPSATRNDQAANRESQTSINSTELSILSMDEQHSQILDQASFALRNISLEIKKGELIAVIGRSGSGKSSLLLSFLNELNFIDHPHLQFAINPSISFVSQKPWLQNESLKENILFGKVYDDAAYRKAIYLSCLEDDLRLLNNGSDSVIGDKGLNLSGGQKVRVSIARAIYQNSDLILMDDPLSALDSGVGDFILRKSICEKLKGKTRIIVTQNIGYLDCFDKIIFMEKGQIKYFGPLEGLKRLDSFIELQTLLEEIREAKKSQENNEKKPDDDEELFRVISNEGLVPAEDVVVEEKSESLEQPNQSTESNSSLPSAKLNFHTEIKEKTKAGFSLFFSYLGIGRFSYFIIPILGIIAFVLIGVYRYAFYNEQGSTPVSQFDKIHFFKILWLMEAGLLVIGICRGIFVYLFGLSVSANLSTLLIYTLLHAPLNSFFNRNSVGKILNRISGDIDVVDRTLPMALTILLNMAANLLLNISLIIFFSSHFVSVFIALYIVMVVKLYKEFTQAYSEITHINASSKSPIINLFSDCVHGLIDIRANQKMDHVNAKVSIAVDFHVKTCFVASGFGPWFRLRLLLLSSLIVIPVFGYVLLFQEDFLDYVAILVSVLMMNMDTIAALMNSVSTVEKSFVAFDRCKYYLDLTPESGFMMLRGQLQKITKGYPMSQIKQQEDNLLNTNDSWPTEGRIVFKNVGARYNSNARWVLRSLNFDIRPGEKIGLIGRTGAGKSSLIMMLFRFFEETEGEIEIDGINIDKVDVKYLRRNLTYISQDSYFFEGTVRENLDPFSQSTDEAIIALLKEANIYDKIELAGGLDSNFRSGSINLSAGESQILCFIRAVINLRKIVIMDEATSSLDLKSEKVLETMQHKYFRDCTTIIITHRLSTLSKTDRVILLANGRIQSITTFDSLRNQR